MFKKSLYSILFLSAMIGACETKASNLAEDRRDIDHQISCAEHFIEENRFDEALRVLNKVKDTYGKQVSFVHFESRFNNTYDKALGIETDEASQKEWVLRTQSQKDSSYYQKKEAERRADKESLRRIEEIKVTRRNVLSCMDTVNLYFDKKNPLLALKVLERTEKVYTGKLGFDFFAEQLAELKKRALEEKEKLSKEETELLDRPMMSQKVYSVKARLKEFNPYQAHEVLEEIEEIENEMGEDWLSSKKGAELTELKKKAEKQKQKVAPMFRSYQD